MGRPNVRSGIVGSGFAAAFHFEAIRRVFSVRVLLRGVYSPNHNNSAFFAKERGLKVWDNLDSFLDAIDVIHVCTPSYVHEEIVIAALERDKYAIVEKTLTGYFDDGNVDFNGANAPKETVLEQAGASVERMRTAEKQRHWAFYRAAAFGEKVESDSSLAADAISTIYAGYVSEKCVGTKTDIPHIM